MTRSDFIAASALVIGLAALLVPAASFLVEPHHDGIMLKPALDVLSGQVLFRESFTQYGALTCYLEVFALWLQPTLYSVRLLTVAAYAVTLLFLFASWRMILPRPLAIVAGVLFILFNPSFERLPFDDGYWVMLPWSSVFAMMFQCIGLHSLFCVIRGDPSGRAGLLLGLVCACAFWCRQPVGLTMFASVLAIGIMLLWTGWSPPGRSRSASLTGFAIGLIVVNAIFLGHILFTGAMSEWWYQNFVWPRNWAKGAAAQFWKTGYPKFFTRPNAGGWLLLGLLIAAAPNWLKIFGIKFSTRGMLVFGLILLGAAIWQHEKVLHLVALRESGWTTLLPFLVIVQAIITCTLALTKRHGPHAVEFHLVAALAIFSVASLSQYFPVPDPWHSLWSLAPAFGMLVYVFWRGLGWRAPATTAAIALAFAPAGCTKIRLLHHVRAEPVVTLARPAILRRMRVPPDQARIYAQIDEAVNHVLAVRPDIPSVLVGSDALHLCYTPNHENPLPYFVTWDGLSDDQSDLQRWNYVRRARPLLFVQNPDGIYPTSLPRQLGYVTFLTVPKFSLQICVPREMMAPPGSPAPSTSDPPARN